MPKNADPDRRRRWLALGCNVLVPGAALIALRREWLGIALALLFAGALQGAMWGSWLIPADVPGWLTHTLLGASIGLWLAAQALAWGRARQVLGPQARHEIELLCEQASLAMSDGRYAEARDLLHVALALNDEDPSVACVWARLMTSTGQFAPARRAWRRVLRLDYDNEYEREAVDALERLPES
jgi:tetratricopeptide (TPR) repeat protein